MSEAPENAQPPAQFNPGSNRRTADEDRAWAQLYASVGQAATAEEVVTSRFMSMNMRLRSGSSGPSASSQNSVPNSRPALPAR